MEQITKKRGCGVLVINAKNQILLGLRCKPGDDPVWCMPGGTIEEGELSIQGAIRELKEETNLEAIDIRLADIITADEEWDDYIFVCDSWMGFVKPQTEEMSKFKFFNLEQLIGLDMYPATVTALRKLNYTEQLFKRMA